MQLIEKAGTEAESTTEEIVGCGPKNLMSQRI